MGQKTHPIGLRVGLWQRKWNNTWYASNTSYNKIFFAQHRTNEMLQNFFYSYNMTKKMFTDRALLINTRFIKSNITLGFLFIFFYKFRAKRVRRIKKAKKTFKKKYFIKKKRYKKKNYKNIWNVNRK